MSAFGGAQAVESAAVSVASRRVVRVWFGLLFMLGLGYIVLIPPFQSVDEVAHWDRMWSVSQGDYNCTRIPARSGNFVDLAFRFDSGTAPTPVTWSIFRDTWSYVGLPGVFRISTNGCHYPPVGYVPAALATRVLTRATPDDPRPHQMFFAFYGARLANWLFFFGCVVIAFRVARFPLAVLVPMSIPMVVHQAVSLNNDCFQFGCLLVTLALLSATPTRARLWTAIALITLLSAIKPINLIVATLVWMSTWVYAKQQERRPIELFGMVVASLALPVAAWLTWQATMYVSPLGVSTGMPVADVDEAAQFALIREDPMRFFHVIGAQIEQLYTAPPINGGWRGIFLGLGWYRHVAPDYVYGATFVALLSGLPLLRRGARGAFSEPPVPRVLVLAAAGSVVVFVVTVVMILYLTFTPVGHSGVFGVQGRYFLFPLITLLFLQPMAARRPPWLRGRALQLTTYTFLLLSFAANALALYAMRGFFWEA